VGSSISTASYLLATSLSLSLCLHFPYFSPFLPRRYCHQFLFLNVFKDKTHAHAWKVIKTPSAPLRCGRAEQKNIKMNDVDRQPAAGRQMVDVTLFLLRLPFFSPNRWSRTFLVSAITIFSRMFLFSRPPQSPATFPRLKGKKKSHHQCHRSISSSDSCTGDFYLFFKKLL
jgi:hypothetical protein